MFADSFRPSRIGCAAFLIGALIAPPAIANASDCPADTAAIVAQAKAALGKPEQIPLTGEDRAALSCLADALAAVNSRLEDLIAGKLEFSGNVVAPGFLHTKQEATKAGAK